MDFIRKNFKLLVGVGVVMFAGIIIWSILFIVVIFRITSVTPGGDTISIYQPRIIVTFNKALSSENLKVTFDEKEAKTTIDGSTLTVTLDQALSVNAGYVLEIKNIQAVSGDVIKNQKFDYKTSSDPRLISPEDDALILEIQDDKEGYFSDPIMQYMPHGALNYTISGIEKDEKVVIKISVILSAADVRIDRNAAIERARQDAMKYLGTLDDIDISTYEIQTEVVEPTL